jgi:hypothetical protein
MLWVKDYWHCSQELVQQQTSSSPSTSVDLTPSTPHDLPLKQELLLCGQEKLAQTAEHQRQPSTRDDWYLCVSCKGRDAIPSAVPVVKVRQAAKQTI